MILDFLVKKRVESNVDKLKLFIMFFVGSELFEVLGFVFLRRCYLWLCEVEKIEDNFIFNISEIIESSMLISDLGSDYFLGVVVVNFVY